MAIWMKLLPVAKIMVDTLNTVIEAETNVSPIGKITKKEIEIILLNQVKGIIGILGSTVIDNEQKQ